MGFGAFAQQTTKSFVPKDCRMEELFNNCADFPYQNHTDQNNNRIVGGVVADLGEIPWQANLHGCGGTFLCDKFVLTAAHCVAHPDDSTRPITRLSTVVFGDHDKTNIEENQKAYEVQEIILHPEFSWSTTENDIAIIELKKPVEKNKFVKNACLPRFEPEQGPFLISGWGKIDSNGPKSDKLLKASVDLVPRSECASVYEEFGKTVTDNMICAARKGIDTCQGDSGGIKLLIKLFYVLTNQLLDKKALFLSATKNSLQW